MINKILKAIIPLKKDSYIFESHDDFTEGSWFYYQYLKNKGINNLYWYVRDGDVDKAKELGIKKYVIVESNAFINKIKRYYLNNRIQYFVFSHKYYGPWVIKKKQRAFFFGHGTLFKNVRGYLENIPPFVVWLATSDFAQDLLKIGNSGRDIKYLVCLNPRVLPLVNDGYKVNCEDFINGLFKNKGELIIMLNTYHSGKYSYNDYNQLFEYDNLKKLNAYLKDSNHNLIVKLHPVFKAKTDLSSYSFSNIVFLLNGDLRKYNIDVYSLLAYSSLLITDYSSIFTDYYLTNKPIIFIGSKYLDDSNNFIIDNVKDYMAGPIVYSIDELIDNLKNIELNDGYGNKRLLLNKKFNVSMDDAMIFNTIDVELDEERK